METPSMNKQDQPMDQQLGGAKRLTRRDFIRLSGLSALTVGGASFLTACGPAAQGTSDAGSAAEAGSSSTAAPSRKFAEDGTMLVGMEANYAPYNWQADTETEFTIPIDNVSGAFADGYDVQFAKVIAEAFDAEPRAVAMSFDGLVEACKRGQIDIICAGMTATPERAESVDFSDPYLEDTVAVITKQGSQFASAKSLDDLKGITIVGQKSTFYDEAIDQIPEVNHVEGLEFAPDVVAQLDNDQVEAITYSGASAAKLLESYPDFVVVEFDDGKGFTGDYASNNDNAAIAKGQDDVLKKINEAIANVPQDQRDEMWTACNERQPQ